MSDSLKVFNSYGNYLPQMCSLICTKFCRSRKYPPDGYSFNLPLVTVEDISHILMAVIPSTQGCTQTSQVAKYSSSVMLKLLWVELLVYLSSPALEVQFQETLYVRLQFPGEVTESHTTFKVASSSSGFKYKKLTGKDAGKRYCPII